MRVRTFRNLNRRCFSIQVLTGPGFRTVAWADAVLLRDCQFHVSAAGRLYAQQHTRRHVHAWATGELDGWTGSLRPNCAVPIPPALAALPDVEELPWAGACYTPFGGPDTFWLPASMLPLFAAERAMLSLPGGLRVLAPT